MSRKIGTLRMAFFVFLLVLPIVSQAQITNVVGDQAPPIAGAGHDYLHSVNETVNPANGAVSIRIAVPMPPSRGFTVPFSFGYDSNAAYHLGNSTWGDNNGYVAAGGWSYVIPRLSVQMQVQQYTNFNTQLTSTCRYFTDYVFTDIHGTSHSLGLSIFEPIGDLTCYYQGQPGEPLLTNDLVGGDATVQATTGPWVSGDGSNAISPVTVADEDGTVYYFSGSRGWSARLIGSKTEMATKSLSLPTVR